MSRSSDSISSSHRNELREHHSRDPEHNLLFGCEKLKPKVTCDTVYLSQIIPLIHRRPGTCHWDPVTIPTIEIQKLCAIAQDRETLVAGISDIALAAAQDVKATGAPLSMIAAERRRVSRGMASKARRHLPDERMCTTVVGQLQKKMGSLMGTNMLPNVQTHHLGNGLADALQQVVASLPLPMPPAIRPSIGFHAVYRQDWCLTGYTRGRLLRSIPLTADGRKEISVKSWRIRKELREDLESVENDISTEIVGDEKWSHATTKQVSADLNQTLDGNLKVSGEVPVKSAGKVGAEAGAGSKTSGSVSGSITDTEERVHQATMKAAETLRTKTQSTVETSTETGFETSTKDVIVNPNKCHTLTYHFFEVSESYEVSTRIDDIVPVLLVPLPQPVITPEWLLCHECLLRKHLPCRTFYPGFDAAKLILARGLLGEFLGDLGGKGVTEATDVALGAVTEVVSTYLSLKNAGYGVVPADGGGLGDLLDQGVGAINDVIEKGGDFLEGAGEQAGEIVEGIGNATGQIVNGLGETVEVALSFFGLNARTAMEPGESTQVLHTPGGFGSAMWWAVAEIVSPELDRALSGLETSHRLISQMPAGPERVRALSAALQTFFATLGDADEVFRRIDIGLAVVAGAIVAAGVLSVGAVAGLLAATGGAGAIVAAKVIGAAGMAGLTQLGAFLVAVLTDDSGLTDVIPDDGGLQTEIGGLFGLAQQLGHTADLPMPPDSDDPAVFAAYQQALLEAKARREEMADARVELDRLICHIRRNISHYTEIVWSAVPAADLTRILSDTFSIPSHMVEPKVIGFDDGRAAFRVTDPSWLNMSDIDIDRATKELEKLGLIDTTRQTGVVDMPSPGVTVEPELGECPACDDYIATHRAHDLKLKAEEVAQTQLETERLKRRLEANLLADPSPFDTADSVSVAATAPPDLPTEG